MTQNVGGLDRVLRIAVGLVLVGLAATDNIGAWGFIGVVPLLTGLFRYCPAYSIFGCKTGGSGGCGTGCGTGCGAGNKTDCK